ncbi:acid-soluble spore protein N [Pseudalkalibacillus decolorationis]|nr:acid-soluble spore protein N [Pseudalkalibacillus decolorationis]
MSNPKRHPEQYVPNHMGTQPRVGGGNKGKQMGMKSNEQPQYIPPKG